MHEHPKRSNITKLKEVATTLVDEREFEMISFVGRSAGGKDHIDIHVGRFRRTRGWRFQYRVVRVAVDRFDSFFDSVWQTAKFLGADRAILRRLIDAYLPGTE